MCEAHLNEEIKYNMKLGSHICPLNWKVTGVSPLHTLYVAQQSQAALFVGAHDKAAEMNLFPVHSLGYIIHGSHLKWN